MWKAHPAAQFHNGKNERKEGNSSVGPSDRWGSSECGMVFLLSSFTEINSAVISYRGKASLAAPIPVLLIPPQHSGSGCGHGYKVNQLNSDKAG